MRWRFSYLLLLTKKLKVAIFRYYQDIVDRLYGKAQSTLDVTSNGESIKGNAIIFKDYGAED